MEKFFKVIGSFFVTIWKGAKPALIAAATSFLTTFVHDDLGALAVDAVEFIESSMPGADALAKRDAAVVKFKADAIKAGHDIENFLESTFNWFIETAVQALKAKIADGEPQTATSV